LAHSVLHHQSLTYPPRTGYELEETFNGFLREYTESGSEVHDLATLVAFNKQLAEICLPKRNPARASRQVSPNLTNVLHIEAPDQSELIKAIEDRPSDELYRHALEHLRKIGRDEGLDKAFNEHDLDIVIGPMDSPTCSLSMASGRSRSFANVLEDSEDSDDV
jgi:amidase